MFQVRCPCLLENALDVVAHMMIGRKHTVIYVSFFFSGASALMYEIIWTRYFTITFGSTTYSITTVLTAYMAGLALGSLILGRIADRIRRRLMLYGLLELLIGIYAVAFPFLFDLASDIYIIDAVGLSVVQKLMLRFALSFIIMLVPTTLMGGTLPVLSRLFIRQLREVSSRLGALYAVNTFGAVAGTFAAGFYLIATIGTSSSLRLAAAINILIGIGMVAYSRRFSGAPDEAPVDCARREECPETTTADRVISSFAVAAFMMSGFIALSYEIVWTRVLTLIIGSSTYSFSIILIGFLIGIALGSYVVGHTRILPVERINLVTFSWIQIAIGISAFTLIPLFSKLPFVMLKAFKLHPGSYSFITFYEFMLALLIMIIPTSLMGATLPVIAKIVSRRVGSLGASIGNIYFFNTFGAIFGSLLTGFLFIPHFGTLNTLKAGISTNIILGLTGILLFTLFHETRKAFVVSILVAGIGLAGVWKSGWDISLMDSGVAIYGPRMAATVEKNNSFKQGSKIVYYSEGINSTITVRKIENGIYLKTNGKTDAGSGGGDMKTQAFLGYLPVILHQGPRKALVIGLGSGVTAGTIGQFATIRSIDIVEIEPSVVEAASFFRDYNHNVLEDPRTRIFVNDARNHLLESREKYDLIVSEPSNPWISGIGSLYTTDHLSCVRRRLNPQGIFCQWIHCYSISRENLKMILKTTALSFPHTQLWHDTTDLLLIGSNEPIAVDTTRISDVINFSDQTRADFSEYLFIDYPNEILGRLLLDRSGILEYTGDARVNSDDHPYLEFLAPRDLYSENGCSMLDEIISSSKDMPPRLLNKVYNPQDLAMIHYDRSKLYTSMDYLQKGMYYIKKALLLDNKNENYYFQMGEILLAARRYAEAKNLIELGLRINRTARGVRLMVRFMNMMGNKAGALRLLEQNKAVFSYYEEEVGKELHASGNHILAIPFLIEALRKEQPERYLLLERIGDCYNAVGRLELAEKYYLQSILNEEMNIRARLALADLYYKQGKYEEARKHSLFILQYWPEASFGPERLKAIFSELNSHQKPV